ncbi:hypothetical protein BN844_4590 [Pseudomonas sp. SHC52]|nr:hypothetical protein BN844_4590 [Pseudomonas sp. SHC52]
MDQVVLQLVGQRGEKSVEQQAHPTSQVPVDVKQRRSDHPRQGERQNARTQGILMEQDRVASAQRFAMGQYHLANMGGSLVCIQSLGTCATAMHGLNPLLKMCSS